jgi:hypothetical protein
MRTRCHLASAAGQRAAILLEVVLALALFAAAAAIIGTGLGSSIDAVERQRLSTHAADMATSVLAEIQLGIRKTETGPEAFEAPFEHWSWELRFSPVESELGQGTQLSLVEVIIRHDDPPLVHRLGQVLKLDGSRPKLEARLGP